MRQSGQTFQINAYHSAKLKQVEEKKDKLKDIINTLAHLKYEKGTREGDYRLRDRLKDLVNETENNYRAIRDLGGGKPGTAEDFGEFLTFYRDHYLDNFLLIDYLKRLKKEIADQARLDREYNMNNPGRSHERRKNLFVLDFERDLAEWEKTLSLKAVPLLNDFLIDANELALCRRMNAQIDRLVTADDVVTVSGAIYDDFKKSVARFVEMYVKIRKQFLSEKDIRDLVNQALEEMGFKNIILRSKNVNQLRFNVILDEIIKEYGLENLAQKFMPAGARAVGAPAEKEGDNLTRIKEMGTIMEDLCFLENIPQTGPGEKDGVEAGLANRENERYLFYTPGTFDVSLRYIAEYLRDALIFVIDWLLKEMQKNPEFTETLEPIGESVVQVNKFIEMYKRGLEIAAMKSNRSESKVLSQEKHYISKNMAMDLIQTITAISKSVQQALIDSSYNAASLAGKGSVLLKKIKIIQDSFNNSFVKITKGLSTIDTV